MSLAWECIVPGNPVPQGRPRFARCGVGVRTYTPKKSADWKALAAARMRSCFGRHEPLDEPVRLLVVAVFARPKRIGSASKVRHTVRPDADNIGKIVADALTKAGVIRDDCLVCDLRVLKMYGETDQQPHVLVRVETIE